MFQLDYAKPQEAFIYLRFLDNELQIKLHLKENYYGM